MLREQNVIDSAKSPTDQRNTIVVLHRSNHEILWWLTATNAHVRLLLGRGLEPHPAACVNLGRFGRGGDENFFGGEGVGGIGHVDELGEAVTLPCGPLSIHRTSSIIGKRTREQENKR